jgi:hypothetical protein
VLYTLEPRAPVPDIHPSWYPALAPASSIPYLFAWTQAQRIVMVTIALLADFLDCVVDYSAEKGHVLCL